MDARMGRKTAWALAALLLAANVAGYAFDLYGAYWWFDRVLHAATIFAMTFWVAVFVFDDAIRQGRAVRFVVLLACVGIAIGALWEVAEWAFDQAWPGDVIKGKHDTLMDVVMDTAGAVLAALLALRCRPRGAPDQPRLREASHVR